MNLTRIKCYAEGYYSGNTYEDNLIIRTETYVHLESDILSMNLYKSELDGKHSEVKCNITVEHYWEKDIPNINFDDFAQDGDTLHEHMFSVFKNNHLDLNKELECIEEYLKTVDTIIIARFKVKKSQVAIIEKFIENLNKE
jgi:hypothetical protein